MTSKTNAAQVALPVGFEQISEDVHDMCRELDGLYRYHGPQGAYRLKVVLISVDRSPRPGACAVWSSLALQWNEVCTLAAAEITTHRLPGPDIVAQRTAALQQARNRLLERALAVLAP